MTDPPLLPVLGQPPRERSDAARNREVLLRAAQRLVRERDPECVTMADVARAAGVGKGTVFRRFESREGLMAALVDAFEVEWQGSVISGPPPLGPGAAPYDRLRAFGRSRIEHSLRHRVLIEAAGSAGTRNYAAFSFAAMHVRYLLGQLGVTGDLPLLATALLAPLEVPILAQQTEIEQMDVDRIHAGWLDLVGRVTGSGHPGSGHPASDHPGSGPVAP